MVRLTYLDPYVVYRVKPPVIMPESEKNRKKGQAYMVLAPSIEDEFNYLAKDSMMRYRFVTNYFVEKAF